MTGKFEPYSGVDLRQRDTVAANLREGMLSLAGRLERGLKTIISRPVVDIELREIGVKTFAQFVEQQPDLADIVITECVSSSRAAGWIIERSLISHAVDCIFGGNARTKWFNQSKNYSNLELAIRQRFLSLLCSSFKIGLLHDSGRSPISTREERRAVNAAICRLTENIVFVTFRVSIGDGQSTMTFFTPTRVLGEEPTQIPDVPSFGGDSGTAGATVAGGPAAGSIDIPLEAQLVLCDVQFSIAKLMSLSIGQIIPISIENTPCTLKINGKAVFSGRHGLINGRYGMQITKVLASSAGDASPINEFSSFETSSDNRQNNLATGWSGTT